MQLDNNFLEELGLGNIPEDEKKLMLQDIAKVLAARVGEKAEQALNEAQQEEFGKLLDSGDQQAVTGWLANNLPSYQTIVAEEIERIKEEIKPQVPGIIDEFSGPNAEHHI